MAIQPQEEELLQRILGLEAVPDDVAAEYALRQSMFHRSGGSGPLGPLALIDLVRFLRRRPPEVKPSTEKTDWSAVPLQTRVEALYFGDWKPGVYLGQIQHGSLGIRLDEETQIREVMPHVVRIAVRDEPPVKEEPVAKSDTVSYPNDSQPVIELPAQETPPEAPQDVTADAGGAGWTPNSKFDWTLARAGEAVWATVDGDPQDGKFLSLVAGNQVVVDVGGKEYTLPESDVILVNAPQPVEA